MSILKYHNYYLVGIKGVAMTALAECLVDAGKIVSGCDLEEDFVTKISLETLGINIDRGFDQEIPHNIDCIIYTAAHDGMNNKVVQSGLQKSISIYSYAQAVSQLAKEKELIAVSGVGGKSTVTAMIVWIMEKAQEPRLAPSYVVGVGGITGLNRTGRWIPENPYFVLEADEYVDNPSLYQNKPTPKLLLLHPQLAVCTNLKFDHPDIYHDFEQTKATFSQFFQQIKPGGTLIYNSDDIELQSLIDKLNINSQQLELIPFSSSMFKNYRTSQGMVTAELKINNQTINLELKIPGMFNLLNALSAILAAQKLGINPAQSTNLLASFHSTKRRFEFVGQRNGVSYYDDYAHHPHEISKTFEALKEWHPNSKRYLVFQPHTFSRTKKLFDDFVDSLSTIDGEDELIIADIFGSAREKSDPNVSSQMICEAIKSKHPNSKCINLATLAQIASYLSDCAMPGDVVMTMGAGDIYQVYNFIQNND